MRIGYLGPEGTHSHEALLGAGAAGPGDELVPLATNHDVIAAVQDRRVDEAFSPLESSVEGGVNETLDALLHFAHDVRIVGEHVHAVHHSLVAPPGVAIAELTSVRSHPQGLAQCAGWLRTNAPGARTIPVSSTAQAVRAAMDAGGPAGAIGTRTAAGRYGAVVLAEGIEDEPGNATRFVRVARAGAQGTRPATKTSVVFHGAGDASPGWLVRCLSEFAFRGVNLTRIESRPLRSALGHYLFHVDLDGGVGQTPVDEAIAALHLHCKEVLVLGSYAAAVPPGPPEATATLRSGHGGPLTT